MATVTDRHAETTTHHLTADDVWHELDRASFAVIGYVTPSGHSRSSGVVYKTVNRRLYTVVAAESWKARHIAVKPEVSVTVPVRRAGVLSLMMPIPPATISFSATAIVHQAGSMKIATLSKELAQLMPSDGGDDGVVIELVPEGRFVTYGIGVSLMDMRKTELARALVKI